MGFKIPESKVEKQLNLFDIDDDTCDKNLLISQDIDQSFILKSLERTLQNINFQTGTLFETRMTPPFKVHWSFTISHIIAHMFKINLNCRSHYTNI